MPSIPYQLEQRLQAKVAECIHLASERFDTYFPQPTIKFIDSQYAAGCCDPINWTVYLGSDLVLNEPEKVCSNTLPHEVAHLIDFKMNFAVYTSMKRVPWHGYGWRTIMKTVFKAPALTYYNDV